MKHARQFTTLLFLMLLAATAVAQAQVTTEQRQHADKVFNAGEWKEAVKAYTEIANAEPTNGWAWFRVGYAQYSLGDFSASAKAYHKAVEAGRHPVSMYNLACSYARGGDNDAAWKWLDSAVHNGFAQPELMRTDTDIQALRDRPNFEKLVTVANTNAYPCTGSPEYRQLDFWVGNWRVYDPQGNQVGTNLVERILNECVILENWKGTLGSNGKSFNIYDASTGEWHQTWVNDRGVLSLFDGEFVDGSMRFTSTKTAPDGTTYIDRVVLKPMSDDEVQQHWERSKDNGKTWTTVFLGKYVRAEEEAQGM
jgi:hypothetical protein